MTTETALADVRCPSRDCEFAAVNHTVTVEFDGFEWECPHCETVVFEPFDGDMPYDDDPSEPWMDPEEWDE